MKKFFFTLCICSITTFNSKANYLTNDSISLKSECELYTKEIRMKQVEVIDSSICSIIDSAWSFVREEKQIFSRPYACILSLKPTPYTPIKDLNINFSSSYLVFNGSDRASKYYLFNYKGKQIVIDMDNFNLGLNQFFRLTIKENNYFAYFTIIKGDINSTCLESRNFYNQKIIFSLQELKNKRSKFSFVSYTYSLY